MSIHTLQDTQKNCLSIRSNINYLQK